MSEMTLVTRNYIKSATTARRQIAFGSYLLVSELLNPFL